MWRVGWDGHLFVAGRLFTFLAFKLDAYWRWALIRINMVIYLRVVSRPRLVCIDIPFDEFRSWSVQKEGNTVFSSATASVRAVLVALGIDGRVEIEAHLHGTVGCGVLVSGKVELVDRLGVQHAHHLACRVGSTLV